LPRFLIALGLLACLVIAFAQTPAALGKGKPAAASPTPSASPTENPLERIATLQQTVKDNPNDTVSIEELGVLLIQNGKPREGRDQLENAARLGVNDTQVWFFIGVADRELGDEADGVIALEKAEIIDPGNQAVLTTLIDAYLGVNRLDDALKIANRSIALHPQEAFGYLGLATVELDKGQFEQGRANLNKALSIDPNDPRTRMLLGRSYLGDKNPNPDLAIEQFDILLKADPKSPDALRAKAEALSIKGDIGGAVALLQQIVVLQPANVEPEDDIAELYLSKKMIDAARKQFALAIKDHPKATEPFVLQAEYDRSEKRYAQAAQEYDAAIAIAPDDLRTTFEYGKMELEAKDPAKAIDLFNKVLAKDPSNPDAMLSIGQAYAMQGKWLQARDEYRKAFEITHAYIPLFNLGLAYYNLKDYVSARDVFEALAGHQDPKHPDPTLWYVLGETERQLGAKKNAVAAYKNFLAIVPNGEAADKARAYIKQMSQ
jgi:tetratricopeptide (TPR) repeat protein